MNDTLKLMRHVDAILHEDPTLWAAVEDLVHEHQQLFDDAMRLRRMSQPAEPFDLSWREAMQSTGDSLAIASLGNRIRRRAAQLEAAPDTDDVRGLTAAPEAFVPAWIRSSAQPRRGALRLALFRGPNI